MAVADYHLSFLLPPIVKKRKKSSPLPFEDRLVFRLQSLFPIPESSLSLPLSWFSRAVDLLSKTLADASVVLSDPSISSSDQPAIAVYLDSSICLLDACNSVSAATDSILGRRLPLLLAIRHLSSSGEKSVRRARTLLSEWELDGAACSADQLIIHDPPARGSMSAVRRVIYAVEAVSYLVIVPLVAVLCGGEDGRLGKPPVVSGSFAWSSAFNDVGAAVWRRIGAGFSSEIVAVEVSVRGLTNAIDEVKDGDDGERVRVAVLAVERAEEKLTAEFGDLSAAVNGLFDSALSARDAALQSFRARPQKCG